MIDADDGVTPGAAHPIRKDDVARSSRPAPQPPRMTITCVVPCLNERYELPAVLRLLTGAPVPEGVRVDFVVVDGGSTDGSAEVLADWPDVRLLASPPLRARQMNLGARASEGDVLYFVHADTRPPRSCFRDVAAAVAAGHRSGGYPFAFDSASALLRFNAWMTGFNVLATRGGDQSIFVTRDAFEAVGGFRESMTVMEEYSLLRDLRRAGVGFHLFPEGRTLVSARKYEGRSWARVQVANVCAMSMWRLGRPADAIRETYARVLSWPHGQPADCESAVGRTYGKPDGGGGASAKLDDA